MSGSLDGLRVLDMTQNLGGPFCSMNLADHGADVIKIEPKGGDMTRHTPPFIEGESVPFMMWNRNKRSVALDLKDPVDHKIFMKLLGTADILLESNRPGAMARLGLDFESLKDKFPRLIYGSLSGYGQTGPYSRRGGFDVMLQGFTGLMSVNGEPTGMPLRLPIPFCDLTAGLYLTIGVLAAIEARHRSGRGQNVDTSLMEAGTALQVYEAVHYFSTRTNPPRMGHAHRGAAPYQIFPTADSYITIGAPHQHFYCALCNLIGKPELISDPRFASQSDRLKNKDELIGLLSLALQVHTTEHWLEKLDGLGIPCGPVLTHAQLFNHPQILERRMVEAVQHPTAGTVQTLGIPIKLSATPGSLRKAAPRLGEDNQEILDELSDRAN